MPWSIPGLSDYVVRPINIRRCRFGINWSSVQKDTERLLIGIQLGLVKAWRNNVWRLCQGVQTSSEDLVGLVSGNLT